MIAVTQGYETLALKAVSIFWGFCGLHMILDSTNAAKVWGFPPLQDDIGKFWMRVIGHGLIASMTFIGSMIFCNYDPMKAVGVGTISWVIFFFTEFVTGDFSKLHIRQKLMLLWTLFHTSVVVTTLTS